MFMDEKPSMDNVVDAVLSLENQNQIAGFLHAIGFWGDELVRD